MDVEMTLTLERYQCANSNFSLPKIFSPSSLFLLNVHYFGFTFFSFS